MSHLIKSHFDLLRNRTIRNCIQIWLCLLKMISFCYTFFFLFLLLNIEHFVNKWKYDHCYRIKCLSLSLLFISSVLPINSDPLTIFLLFCLNCQSLSNFAHAQWFLHISIINLGLVCANEIKHFRKSCVNICPLLLVIWFHLDLILLHLSYNFDRWYAKYLFST